MMAIWNPGCSSSEIVISLNTFLYPENIDSDTKIDPLIHLKAKDLSKQILDGGHLKI